MSDDEGPLSLREQAPVTHYGETMLYDFAKFMTTLSLLALGGVLTITQTAEKGDIKLFNMAFVLISISMAGALAFTSANGLATARGSGKEPQANLAKMIHVSTALLGIGTGGFLMMWWDSLR